MARATWTNDDETIMTLDPLSIHCSFTSFGDATLGGCGAETGSEYTPHENGVENAVLAEYHHGVTPREQGTAKVRGAQLVPESMGERERGVFDICFG